MISRLRCWGVIMLTSLALAAHAAAPASPSPAPDLPAVEWKAIKGIIGAQITALKRGDGVRAFGFATRGLQLQFESPENFMRMVHAGYQPLIDARYSEFLDGALVDGVVVQPLRLVLPDNTVLVALYQMQKDDGGHWRIAGCLLAPSTVKAV